MNIQRVHPKAVLPKRGSLGAAGYDLCAAIDQPVVIEPHETVKISTGLKMEIPEGYFGAIVARSGLASKEGLTPIQGMAVIDEDYRGEVFIPLHNHTDTARLVMPMQRIAQMILMRYRLEPMMEVNEDLTETERGEDGFGSTGA